MPGAGLITVSELSAVCCDGSTSLNGAVAGSDGFSKADIG